MKNLGLYTITNCISFTMLVLANSIATLLGKSGGLSAGGNLQLFAVTTLISLLMWLTDQFFGEGITLPQILVQLGCVLLSVFGLGGVVFHWFPFTVPMILIVVGSILVIYFGVLGILELKSRTEAAFINSAIKRKKMKKEEDEGHGGA